MQLFSNEPRARSRHVKMLLVATILTLLACDAGPDPERSAWRWTGSEQVVDGVVVVSNPPRPVLDDSLIKVHPLWSAPSDQLLAEDELWEEPVAVLYHQEAVYVLDRRANRVYVMDGDGARRSTWGREGEGPGEMQNPRGLAVLDDKLVVANGGTASLNFFTPAGELLDVQPLDGVAFGLLSVGGSHLLVDLLRGNQGGWVLRDETGRETPFALRDPAEDAGGIALPANGRRGFLRTSTRLYAPDRSRAEPRWRSATDHLDIPRDRGPDRRRAASRPRRYGEQDGWAGLSPAQAAPVIENSLRELRIKKLMRGVRYDTARELLVIWEQEPDEFGGGNATLHLLTRSGVYLARVPVEARLVDFAIDALVVYALAEDEQTGIVSLAALAIEMPPGAFEFVESTPPAGGPGS